MPLFITKGFLRVLSHAEPSFRESVDIMFNRAVALMDLSPGLEEKIRVCNATYTVRFGVRLRGAIHTFTGYRSVHSEHMEPDLPRDFSSTID